MRLKNRVTSLVDLGNHLSPRYNNLPSACHNSKTHQDPHHISKNSIAESCLQFKNSSKTKTSHKSSGPIKSFAACTNQGLIRSYNEDRVSIIPRLHISDTYPKISYFGLFDGHGGSFCANFLADHLHRYIFRLMNNGEDIIDSIKQGFLQAENDFTSESLSSNFDNSGSCAICALVLQNHIFLANVGDSRAIISYGNGKITAQVSIDHKPDEENEKNRIQKAGGVIVRTGALQVARVMPGRLSVSRSFGDLNAKIKKLGGKPGVVVASPDVFRVKLTDNLDFLVLASDGIFDVLRNDEVAEVVLVALRACGNSHERAGKAARDVVERALEKRTSDNVTCVVLVFKDDYVEVGKHHFAKTKL